MSHAGRVFRSNGEFFLRAAAASPGGSVVDVDGMRAGVVPVAPERPLMNSVLCPPGAGLDDTAYAALASLYERAGVQGWTVWLDPADDQAAGVLRSKGHVLDGRPRAMVAASGDIAGRPSAGGSVVRQPAIDVVARLNDAVYGYPGSLARALRGPLEGCAAISIEVAGEPAAVGMACDVDHDCHITLVATLERYRGRGFATAIIRHLVADAADRGCSTTSLIATNAGAPVYTRMGYRDVGWIDMWERRFSPSSPSDP